SGISIVRTKSSAISFKPRRSAKTVPDMRPKLCVALTNHIGDRPVTRISRRRLDRGVAAVRRRKRRKARLLEIEELHASGSSQLKLAVNQTYLVLNEQGITALSKRDAVRRRIQTAEAEILLTFE